MGSHHPRRGVDRGELGGILVATTGAGVAGLVALVFRTLLG